MHKNIMKTLKSGISVLLISALLFVPLTGLQIQAAEDSSPFAVTDKELNAAREQFFGVPGVTPFSAFDLSEAAEREVVYIEDSNIIYRPQEIIIPEPPGLISPAANYSVPFAGPYSVGDTRPFYTDTASMNDIAWRGIQGKLVAQSKHTNIWVLDDTDFHRQTGTLHSPACHLQDISQAIGKQIADRFDPIYEAMTDPNTGFARHANFQAQVGYGIMPTVGDMGNDGKVNFLLYDLYGDGGRNAGYIAGYFYSLDFYTKASSTDSTPGSTLRNGLDMLHMDIGDGQGYNVLTAGIETDKLDFYGTMAHEFQHFLYYIYYGVYRPSEYESDSWINETLSELAKAFYTDKSKELVNYGRLISAAQNTYDVMGSNKNEYTDFLNHLGYKNYGMERLFAHVLYKRYNNIAKNIYSYMQIKYPPAQSYNQCAANISKITSMPQAVGDFLKAGTSNTIGSGGQNTFSLLYYLFMETFAADGGKVYDTTTIQTTKPYNTKEPIYNLWAVRYAAGKPNGIIYETLGGRYYFGTNYEGIPSISPGGTISLRGYGTVNLKPASHEMLYNLTRGKPNETVLKITAPNDGNNETRYYVAVPNDDLYVMPDYTSGENGASVYPLTKGTPKEIYTKGQEAYLFVVTLYKNVSSQISYSWSAPVEAVAPVISVQPKNFKRMVGDSQMSCNLSVTAKSTDNGTLSYQWYSSTNEDTKSGGTLISGATSANYAAPVNAVGTTYYYTMVTNKITDNGDGGAKTASVTSVAAKVTVTADLNGDNIWDAGDLVILAQHIAEITPISDPELFDAADINGDGKINILDLILLSKRLTGK